MRAVEGALTIGVVALVVCCAKFGWVSDLTDSVAVHWVQNTDPMFDEDAISYVIPVVTVPDRIDPIKFPLPERPSPSPTPSALPAP